MLKSKIKALASKGICFAMRSLPIILTGLLVIHSNSTACIINGQPVPPANLKKYRKF